MRIVVRPESPVPLFEQIISQVVFAIANGDIDAGELLPSVRDLAHKLLVNPNTVTRAFQELERLGIIEARRGVGMALTAESRKLCKDRRKELIRTTLRDALREASNAGLEVDEVHQLVDQEWAKLQKSRTGSASV